MVNERLTYPCILADTLSIRHLRIDTPEERCGLRQSQQGQEHRNWKGRRKDRLEGQDASSSRVRIQKAGPAWHVHPERCSTRRAQARACFLAGGLLSEFDSVGVGVSMLIVMALLELGVVHACAHSIGWPPVLSLRPEAWR